MAILAGSSKRIAVLLSLLSIVALASAQRPHGGTVPNNAGTPATEAAPGAMMMKRSVSQSPAYPASRNAATDPLPNPTPPVFQLSHDYPKVAPPATCTECPWLKVKVNFDPAFPPTVNSDSWHAGHWDEYIKSIIDYVKEGQDPNLDNKVGFQVKVNGKTRWYNVPWMAYDPNVWREYAHGTTNERTTYLNALINGANEPTRGVNSIAGESQDCTKEWPHGFESWSVGFYNEYGGYALGIGITPPGAPEGGGW